MMSNCFDDAMASIECGEYLKAVHLFDEAIAIKQNEGRAWFFRGVAFEKMGCDKEAVASYDRAIPFDKHNVDLLKNHGILLQKLRAYADSITSFDRALTLARDNIEIWIARGDSLSKLERNLDALDSYDKAIAIDPNNANAWYSRGCFLRKIGLDEKADASFAKALIIKHDEREAIREKTKNSKKCAQTKAICLYCGKEFLRGKNYRKKYCSEECAVKNHPKFTCQKILKTHHENLQDDPDRLSTEFIADLVGCECKTIIRNVERVDKKKQNVFEIDHTLLEY